MTWRDKFESGSRNNWMYYTYVASILQLEKKSSRESELRYYQRLMAAPRPTFQQFVDYLLRTEVCFQVSWMFLDSHTKCLFCLHVLQRSFFFHVKDYNDHWRPFWIHCRICSTHFDIIGMFETIDEDAAVIQGVKDAIILVLHNRLGFRFGWY